jgi:hypothetical protein
VLRIIGDDFLQQLDGGLEIAALKGGLGSIVEIVSLQVRGQRRRACSARINRKVLLGIGQDRAANAR